ncbi:unnamed protein product (macronuclear) [Paramecium tetraurelia]|uniref:Uncharacterized protein n=1 Tax=Paramecium tetraurelia TaxID=5888 RepID=A0CK84_PARTE|nr:uncharacterized protein GSPATT00000914001 [Paramecium tetraurelia]CAK71201.1 unnamed protein product [Paramecium tetraurelia]|eukprot:XP_001438598.1 hypothetical protein (macronuclear) [Paramecium tetraurelia strain d4-2]
MNQSETTEKSQNSEKSVNFYDQMNSGGYYIGENRSSQVNSAQINPNTSNSREIPVPNQSEYLNRPEINVQVVVDSNFQNSDQLTSQLSNLKYFKDSYVYQLISSVRANLKLNKQIKNYNLLIQTNKEKDKSPDQNFQQSELNKEKLNQFFQNMKQARQNINQVQSPIKDFLCTKLQDLFPKKTVTQDDHIVLTINLILRQQN